MLAEYSPYALDKCHSFGAGRFSTREIGVETGDAFECWDICMRFQYNILKMYESLLWKSALRYLSELISFFSRCCKSHPNF
jgi:hypothetical protein